MSAETFERFDAVALRALQARTFERLRAESFVEGPAEEVQRFDAYFGQFTRSIGGRCLCCGSSLKSLFGGGFTWGLAHGEGHCSSCGYPMRGIHRIEGLGTLRNVFLAYHPSELSFSEENR